MSKENETLFQIDQISLVSSIGFITICFTLIAFLKESNSPFGKGDCDILCTGLAITLFIFLLCVVYSYADILIMALQAHDKPSGIINIKTGSYIIGVNCFF